MFSALAIRPGRTATNSAAARPIQFGRKDFENSIAMHPIDCFQQRPPNGWLGRLMVLCKSISARSNVLHSLDRSLPRRRRILAQLIARALHKPDSPNEPRAFSGLAGSAAHKLLPPKITNNSRLGALTGWRLSHS